MIDCNQNDCPHRCPSHRWGKVRAQEAGWFFQKDGTAWCPEHVPEWVKEWRARR